MMKVSESEAIQVLRWLERREQIEECRGPRSMLLLLYC